VNSSLFLGLKSRFGHRFRLAARQFAPSWSARDVRGSNSKNVNPGDGVAAWAAIDVRCTFRHERDPDGNEIRPWRCADRGLSPRRAREAGAQTRIGRC
jgi:hypothetical protein